MLAAGLAAIVAGAGPTCPVELFRITRSGSQNVVLYEVDRPAGGDEGAPIHASWRLHDEDGRREELNAAERVFAYGFEATRTPEGIRLALRADRTRPIDLREHAGCLRAFRMIGERPALLDRIHVEVRGGFPFFQVKWVDVLGTDPETGRPLSERIVPD